MLKLITVLAAGLCYEIIRFELTWANVKDDECVFACTKAALMPTKSRSQKVVHKCFVHTVTHDYSSAISCDL